MQSARNSYKHTVTHKKLEKKGNFEEESKNGSKVMTFAYSIEVSVLYVSSLIYTCTSQFEINLISISGCTSSNPSIVEQFSDLIFKSFTAHLRSIEKSFTKGNVIILCPNIV